MDECFVFRIDHAQVVGIVAGPCDGRQAYEALAMASTDDGSVLVIVPSGIVADLVSRLKVVNV